MGDLHLHEIMYDPTGPDTGYQWIELINTGEQPLEVGQWQLQTAGTTFATVFAFPANVILHPGQLLLVGEAQVPNCDFYIKDLKLQNGGSASDGVRLLNQVGEIVDAVIYDSPNTNRLTGVDGQVVPDDQTAPTAPAPFSLAWIDGSWRRAKPTPGEVNDEPSADHFQVKWQFAPIRPVEALPFQIHQTMLLDGKNTLLWYILDQRHQVAAEGTSSFADLILAQGEYVLYSAIENATTQAPPQPFTVAPPLPLQMLWISEVHPVPQSGQEEFIEITNYSDYSIPLYRFTLSDDTEKPTKYSINEVIEIAAHQSIVFYQSQTKLSLNNAGDTVLLSAPSGDLLHHIEYEKSVKGQSWCIDRQSSVTTCDPSPGFTTFGLEATGGSFVFFLLISLASVIIAVLLNMWRYHYEENHRLLEPAEA